MAKKKGASLLENEDNGSSGFYVSAFAPKISYGAYNASYNPSLGKSSQGNESHPVTGHNGGCPCCIGHVSEVTAVRAGSASAGANALKSGSVWANDGTGVTITYKFWSALPNYYANSDTEATNFQVFSDAMKTATREVLDMISSFTKITFQEVASDGDAKMGFAQARLSAGAGAWAYYPGGSQKAGDVWTNNMYANTQNVTKGTYGFMVLLHEIGHALGLKHSFEGVSKLKGAEDSTKYTVMSYTWPFYSMGYMGYDIKALQDMYGINTTATAGNTTHTLQWGKGYAIWDAGGTDLIDGSAQTGAMTIDLREGKLSSVGLKDNISVAVGAVIENANGGSEKDTINGNAVANVINGNGGDDTINGDAGADMLNGGAGKDTIKGGNDNDTISGGTEDDKLYGDNGNDTIDGGDGKDTLYGGAGDDRLTGGAGDDMFKGDAGADTLIGGLGKDNMAGGAGRDVFTFTAVDSFADMITDFQRGGTDKDSIDVSDVLSGFDSLSDVLSDFVRITVSGQKKATLEINADGAGSDWVVAVSITGKDVLTGMTVDNLFAGGQLIVS